jgi:allantoate deiminase
MTFTIEITGEDNHVGTAAMGHRKHAVYPTSSNICAIMDTVKSYGDPFVAAVGRKQNKL